MNMTKIQWQKIGGALISVVLLIASILGWFFPVDVPVEPPDYVMTEEDQMTVGAQASKERVTWLIAKKFTVLNGGAEFQSAVSMTGDTTFGNAAGDTMTANGDMVLNGYRDATTGYDYFYTIEGSATGIVNGAKTYGLLIDMDRPAGYESGGGDLDDAGLKIRVETEAVTTTAGTTLRAVDAEAKADNPDGTVTNLYGGLFTAKSDTSAGSVDTMIALSANTQNNALVTTTLMAADFRLMRQAATAPTNEHVVQIRNSSTSGSGADSAIYVASDYGSSATTDSFDYGLDFGSAAINTAELRGENGETLSNTTDGQWTTSAALAVSGLFYPSFADETITNNELLTPTVTVYNLDSGGNVTMTLAPCDTDGQLLVLVGDDANDILINDTNVRTNDGSTQTIGQYDMITWVCIDTEWIELSESNNS